MCVDVQAHTWLYAGWVTAGCLFLLIFGYWCHRANQGSQSGEEEQTKLVNMSDMPAEYDPTIPSCKV